MKKLAIMLFVCFASVVVAQNNHIVKLKNGSEIRGNLIDIDSTKARIQTRDGSIWVYESTEIAGIEKFYPKVSGKGVFVRAEVGCVGGSELSPSILITNGYSFNEHWDIGLSIGWERYSWSGYVPFLLSGRYNLLNKHFTPYVDVMAGYIMPLRNWDTDRGGLGAGGRLGITRYFGNRLGFSTSVGYRFAYLAQEDSWWDDFITIRQIHRFELKFALTFK